MESPAERRCLKGEDCAHYSLATGPTILGPEHKGPICEACLRAERSGGTGLGMKASERHEMILPSSSEDATRHFKAEVVMQLYLQRGPLYEAISEVRSRRGLLPRTELPPLRVFLPLLPPELSTYPRSDQSEEWEAWSRWVGDLLDLMEYVPDALRAHWPHDWEPFFSVCVLYDPQGTDLIAFAEAGGPYATDAGVAGAAGAKPADFAMVAPPIRTLVDPVQSARVESAYVYEVLQALAELYLEPRGISLNQALERVSERYPSIEQRRSEARRSLQRRDFIWADDATSSDVENARRLISSTRRKPTPGRPRRDRLLAVQCAVLYDRHNDSPDPSDRRRRRWTYQKLAERFGLSSASAAKHHVDLGREVISADRVQ